MSKRRISQLLIPAGLVVLLGLSMLCGAAKEQTVFDESFDRTAEVPSVPVYFVMNDEFLQKINDGGRWHLILDPTARAKAGMSNGSAWIKIEDGGLYWYSVQFSYLPFRLEAAKNYAVTFKARAEKPLELTFDLARLPEFYSYSGRLRFPLTDQWQEYSLSFKTDEKHFDERARLELNVGGDADENTVYVDEIKVVCTE